MNNIIRWLKEHGYILSIPTIAFISIYFIDKHNDIQKEKVEVLKQEISFLKEKQASTAYSYTFSELDSQKKLYENKLKRINEKLLKISLELAENQKDKKRQEALLKEKTRLLQEKEIILSSIKKIIFDKNNTHKNSEIHNLNEEILKLKKINNQCLINRTSSDLKESEAKVDTYFNETKLQHHTEKKSIPFK